MPNQVCCDLCGQPEELFISPDFAVPNGFCTLCRYAIELKVPEPPIPGVTKELQLAWRGTSCRMFIRPSTPGNWLECYIRLNEWDPWRRGEAPTRVHAGMDMVTQQPDPNRYLHFSVLATPHNEEEAKWTALVRMIDRAKLVWLAGNVGGDLKYVAARVVDGRYIRGGRVVDASRGYRELLEEDFANTRVYITERTHQGDRVHRGQ